MTKWAFAPLHLPFARLNLLFGTLLRTMLPICAFSRFLPIVYNTLTVKQHIQ